jgi:hypothetical protein
LHTLKDVPEQDREAVIYGALPDTLQGRHAAGHVIQAVEIQEWNAARKRAESVEPDYRAILTEIVKSHRFKEFNRIMKQPYWDGTYTEEKYNNWGPNGWEVRTYRSPNMIPGRALLGLHDIDGFIEACLGKSRKGRNYRPSNYTLRGRFINTIEKFT